MTYELRPDPYVPDWDKVRKHFLDPVVPSLDEAWAAANEFIWRGLRSVQSEPRVPPPPKEV